MKIIIIGILTLITYPSATILNLFAHILVYFIVAVLLSEFGFLSNEAFIKIAPQDTATSGFDSSGWLIIIQIGLIFFTSWKYLRFPFSAIQSFYLTAKKRVFWDIGCLKKEGLALLIGLTAITPIVIIIEAALTPLLYSVLVLIPATLSLASFSVGNILNSIIYGVISLAFHLSSQTWDEDSAIFTRSLSLYASATRRVKSHFSTLFENSPDLARSFDLERLNREGGQDNDSLPEYWDD